jgi:predicted Rossmann fold nucleotide-binding protein DprA/Smf involved in DNA uptake
MADKEQTKKEEVDDEFQAGEDEDEEDEELEAEDAEDDPSEADDLAADAEIPIEELRKRYAQMEEEGGADGTHHVSTILRLIANCFLDDEDEEAEEDKAPRGTF